MINAWLLGYKESLCTNASLSTYIGKINFTVQDFLIAVEVSRKSRKKV
jgi:hypothetical protein